MHIMIIDSLLSHCFWAFLCCVSTFWWQHCCAPQSALYGCIKSTKFWYDHSKSTLESDGFLGNPNDPSDFNKEVQGCQLSMCLHVDDLLICCYNRSAIDAFLAYLAKVNISLAVNQVATQNYLGMKYDFVNPKQIKITMDRYIYEILTLYNVAKTATSPEIRKLFEVDRSNPFFQVINKTYFIVMWQSSTIWRNALVHVC